MLITFDSFNPGIGLSDDFTLDHRKPEGGRLPRVVCHMLREVRQQYRHGEADVLGRVVKAVRELLEVHFAVLVSVHTHHHVVNLLTEDGNADGDYGMDQRLIIMTRI